MEENDNQNNELNMDEMQNVEPDKMLGKLIIFFFSFSLQVVFKLLGLS